MKIIPSLSQLAISKKYIFNNTHSTLSGTCKRGSGDRAWCVMWPIWCIASFGEPRGVAHLVEPLLLVAHRSELDVQMPAHGGIFDALFLQSLYHSVHVLQ
jgi:hypothetical protein